MATLGQAAIDAAQALSEKFGIATFDLQGKVNTIPITRPYDTSINIGTGSTGLTSKALNDFLAKLSPQKATVPTRPVYSPQTGYTIQPTTSKLTEQEVDLSSRNIQPSFSTTIQQYLPYIVIGGIGLAALTLLRK